MRGRWHFHVACHVNRQTILRRGTAIGAVIAAVCATSSACSRTGLPLSMGGSGSTAASTSSGLCSAATTVRAIGSPLDLYVMLDQSGSMSDEVAGGITKWVAVTNALQAFVEAPNAEGVGIGIQYFAVAPGNLMCPLTCHTNVDCGDACGECNHPFGGEVGTCWNAVTPGGNDSCAAADYAEPEVEIANLPGNAAAIVASMNAHTPVSGTPTSAALQGAIDHASDWAKTHAGHAVVDVLATDGDPSECDTDLGDIQTIAASGLPKIRTFVIGVGSSTANLNGIANAGGTNHAYIVDTDADTNAQFLAALEEIQHIVLACSYQVPTPAGGGTVDPANVNVEFASGDGSPPAVFDQVPNVGDCPSQGGAWYYDNPIKPTKIVLCPATCTGVSADAKGEIDIVLGCKTVG